MTIVYIFENQIYHQIKNHFLPLKLLKNVEKYHNDLDYQNSFIAWLALYEIFKKQFQIDLEKEELLFNQYNKPYINSIEFNISHSNNLIAICISDNRCGIDLEMVDFNKDLTLLKQRLNLLTTVSNELFYQQWTKTEALFKYFGTGIILSQLNKVDLSNINTIKITDYYNNQYYLSIKTLKKEKIKIKYNKIG